MEGDGPCCVGIPDKMFPLALIPGGKFSGFRNSTTAGLPEAVKV